MVALVGLAKVQNRPFPSIACLGNGFVELSSFGVLCPIRRRLTLLPNIRRCPLGIPVLNIWLWLPVNSSKDQNWKIDYFKILHWTSHLNCVGQQFRCAPTHQVAQMNSSSRPTPHLPEATWAGRPEMPRNWTVRRIFLAHSTPFSSTIYLLKGWWTSWFYKPLSDFDMEIDIMIKPNCDIKTCTKTHDSKAPLSPDFQTFQRCDIGLG